MTSPGPGRTTSKTAADITAKGKAGIYGSGAVTGDASFNLWLRQHGKSLFTADGKLGFDEADAKGFFEFQADLRDAEVRPARFHPDRRGQRVRWTRQGLATNKFALGWVWSNQLGALTKASGQPLEIKRPPSTDGNAKSAQQFYKASQFWSASSRTKHPKETQQFIDFLANSVEAGEIALADRGIPGNSEVRAAITPKLSASGRSNSNIHRRHCGRSGRLPGSAPGRCKPGRGNPDPVLQRRPFRPAQPGGSREEGHRGTQERVGLAVRKGR